jgi:DNA polymerase (family 10)
VAPQFITPDSPAQRVGGQPVEGFRPVHHRLTHRIGQRAVENPEVAQLFEEVADLLDIQGANPFRVRAYRNAARTIRDLSESLAGMAEEKLEALAGIGKDLTGKIRTILETGDLPLRQELCGQVPVGLRDLVNVPNLGPKRASTLYQRLHIHSLDELRQAVKGHRIRKLRGFGAKMEGADDTTSRTLYRPRSGT